MILSEFENKLCDELEDRLGRSDFEIVSLSVVGPKTSPILRIYIDVEGGVSFEELSRAQGLISPIVEEIDPFSGAYTLEVSSPGIDRPLRKLSDFDRFKGERAHIRIQNPISNRRNFDGELKGIEDNSVGIECDGERYSLDFDNIQRANLIRAVF